MLEHRVLNWRIHGNLQTMAAEVFDLLLLDWEHRQVASSFPGNLKHSMHVVLSENAQLANWLIQDNAAFPPEENCRLVENNPFFPS